MESPKDVQVDVSLDPESEREEPREAEYLTPRCVLFTYFRGDTASVVDAHFSRALGGARPPVRPSACPGGSKAGAASAGQWKGRSVRGAMRARNSVLFIACCPPVCSLWYTVHRSCCRTVRASASHHAVLLNTARRHAGKVCAHFWVPSIVRAEGWQ